MAAPGTISSQPGAVGQVKFAYYTAAQITGYQIARDEFSGAWMLTGTAASSDAYWLTQTPLTFVIPMKAGAWRWAIERCSLTGTQFEAQLGALDEKG